MLFFGAQNFHQTSTFEAEETMARLMLPEFKSYPRLVSFAFPKNAKAVYRLKSLPDIADKVFIICDCGAYSELDQKAKIKLDDYIPYLKENERVIDYAINLDRIGNGKKSYENYLIMTAEGLTVVPVWHLGTDTKYLCAYLDMADFIGISLRKKIKDPKKQIGELDDLWEYYLTDSDGFPTAKFHLLGLTSLPVISRFPWWSFDNAAWAKVAGYGGIYLPKSDNGIPAYNRIASSIRVSSRSLHIGNHLQNHGADSRQYLQARITSAVLRFGLNHDLDDHQTRYAINLAHYYKVGENQPRWPWPFKRGQIRYG
jgi:hypothetical protein